MIERRAGIYLILPALIIMAVFTVYPLLDGLRIAFTNYNLLGNTVDYVGLANYTRMLSDPIFWLALGDCPDHRRGFAPARVRADPGFRDAAGPAGHGASSRALSWRAG